MTEDQTRVAENEEETSDVEGHGFGGHGGKREMSTESIIRRSDDGNDEDDVEGHGFGGHGGKR